MKPSSRFIVSAVGVLFLLLAVREHLPLFETALWHWSRAPVCGVKGDGPFVDAVRILYRRHIEPGTAVQQWTETEGSFAPVDRTVNQALSWEMSPDAPFSGRDVAKADAIIVSPLHAGPAVSGILAAQGFLLVGELHGTQIWQKGGTSGGRGQDVCRRQTSPVRFRETLAFSVVASLLVAAWVLGGLPLAGNVLAAMCVFPLVPVLAGARHPGAVRFTWLSVFVLAACLAAVRKRRGKIDLRGDAAVCAACFFCLCAFVALSRGLPANNGMGVYGGKAKLWWLSGGFPEGYFTSPKYATMQTSYPLAFPLLVWLVNALSGGVAECAVQLMPPLLLSLCAGSLVSATGGQKRAPLFFSMLLASPGILIATAFYSEPLMAFFLLAGIDAVLQGRRTGFLLLGMCGWVKTEGALVAFAAWCALAILHPPRIPGERQRRPRTFDGLLPALAPGLLWFASSRLCGGEPHDYSPLWRPDLLRGALAAKEILITVVLTPWRSVCALFPACLALVSLAVGKDVGEKRRAFAVLVFPAVSFCGFAYLLSLNLAEDFAWHCRCVQRLLFVPSLAAWRLFFWQNPRSQER